VAQDLRSPTEHDCDRIHYSSAYRRLAGVTQVVAVDEIQLFHTRLTHTNKVAQLSRRLAEDFLRDEVNKATIEAIGGLDANATEAAALAHDLGHPPFGHIAEDVLCECCDRCGADGFEGNAQSFRIVTKLAKRATNSPGLDLQDGTLRAILKYPRLRGAKPSDGAGAAEARAYSKWGAYLSEKTILERVVGTTGAVNRSVEAEIMDWCDDVSYALHDLEDFFRAGLIPLERVGDFGSAEAGDFLTRATHALEKARDPDYDHQFLGPAFRRIQGFFPGEPYSGSDDDRRVLKTKTREFIGAYLGSTSLSATPPYLRIDPDARHEIMLLKQLTWQHVVNHPALATLQEGQKAIVRQTFSLLRKWTLREEKNETPYRLPSRLLSIWNAFHADQEAMDALSTSNARCARIVSDYICSLTEDQLIDLHRRLTGSGSGKSVLDAWIKRH
jgi:dGTPase